MAEGGQRGLVGEVVLAVAEYPQAEVGPVDGDRGAGHQRDAGVVEGLLLGGGRLHAGVALKERADLGRVGIVDPAELGAGLEQAVAHAVDMAVVEADGGECEVARLAHRLGVGGGGRGGGAAPAAHVAISFMRTSPTDAVFSWKCGAAARSPSLVRKGSSAGSGSVTVCPVIAAW